MTNTPTIPEALRHVPGPEGVRGRGSDNARARAVLGWEPRVSLEDGLRETYAWIAGQLGRVPRPRAEAALASRAEG